MDIPRSDWPVLFRLLDEALELPDEVARQRWLEALTGPHRRLQPALRLLLARHDRAEVRELRLTQRLGARLARKLAGDPDTLTFEPMRNTRPARSAAAERLVRDIERCLREESAPQARARRPWMAALRGGRLPALLGVTVLLGLSQVRCGDDPDAALSARPHRTEAEVARPPNISVAPPPSRRYIPSPTEGAEQ